MVAAEPPSPEETGEQPAEAGETSTGKRKAAEPGKKAQSKKPKGETPSEVDVRYAWETLNEGHATVRQYNIKVSRFVSLSLVWQQSDPSC